MFGMPLTKFPQIQVLTSAVVPFFQLWTIADAFKVNEELWMTAKLNTLDSEKIENEVDLILINILIYLYIYICIF